LAAKMLRTPRLRKM